MAQHAAQPASPGCLPGALPRWPDLNHDLGAWSFRLPPRHAHIVPSLSLGGAERIVCDLARHWARQGVPADVAVMRDAPSEYDVSDLAGSSVTVHRLGRLPWRERTERAAAIVRATGLPAYAHLTSPKELEGLWSAGCRTIPVVHNIAAGWNQDPGAWNHSGVPFVAACGARVHGEVRRAGYEGKVRTLRHVLSPLRRPGASQRATLRGAFGCSTDALLIGMVGRVVLQKRYTRAVAILAELVHRGIDARLAIIGTTVGEEGRAARAALLAAAATAGVGDRLSLPGPVVDATTAISAFDVFLNTSIHEGVSIATMEAATVGLPIVSADVGGQREAVPPGDTLLDPAVPDEAWADAVMSAAGRGLSSPAGPAAWLAPVAAASWAWLAALGPGAARSGRDGSAVLFVTANMDVGGAQRSLCNLAEALASQGTAVTVAIPGPVGVPGFMDAARAAGAQFLSLAPAPGEIEGLAGRAGRILALADALRPRTLCFWNVDAPTKFVVARALAGGPVRLVDASPGPMFYAELEDAGDVARTLSTSPQGYIALLDVLVAKYAGGLPAKLWGVAKAHAVIPNGVRRPCVGDLSLAPCDGPRPPSGADPRLAAVCVGRLAPSKHPDLLPVVARRLAELVPGATLTVVGGIHGGDGDASDVGKRLQAALDAEMPANLHFAEPDHRTSAFLPRFACLVMVSEQQGCPNASLEAMAAGLPVVANDDGGTGEQVVSGETGVLVASAPWDSLAARVAEAVATVLSDPARAARMSFAARTRALREFSMEQMASAWSEVLLAPGRDRADARREEAEHA